MILYKGFVRPHLEYAIQAWSPYLRKDIECLERVQRKTTELVQGYKNLSYVERLEKLHLTTLEHESCAIAKMTAQCALHTDALKIFGTA